MARTTNLTTGKMPMPLKQNAFYCPGIPFGGGGDGGADVCVCMSVMVATMLPKPSQTKPFFSVSFNISFISLNFYEIASNIHLVCVFDGRKIPDNDIHCGYNDNLGNKIRRKTNA